MTPSLISASQRPQLAYSTSLNEQRRHQFYVEHLRTQRGATPAQLRTARHKATILALIARCAPGTSTLAHYE